jgi:hypothetical protein
MELGVKVSRFECGPTTLNVSLDHNCFRGSVFPLHVLKFRATSNRDDCKVSELRSELASDDV